MKIVFLSGPSCVGKSSQLIELAKNYKCYIEDTSRNKELELFFCGNESFNAYKSQLWFFENIDAFIKESNDDLIFIDQDTKAIMYVYSKYFLQNGMLSGNDYTELENYYFRLNSGIKRKYSEIFNYYLYAHTATLKKRASQRDSTAFSWLLDIADRFNALYKNDLSIIPINTDQMSLNEVFTFINRSISVDNKINFDNLFLDGIFDTGIRDNESVGGFDVSHAVKIMYDKINYYAVSRNKINEILNMLRNKYKEYFLCTATARPDFYKTIDTEFDKYFARGSD
jgi:guanylate kinase